MSTYNEVDFIASLVKGFPKSPLQKNALQETDAEIVALPGSENWLAITTDTLVEEIETGLYKDPWFIGWMTVVINLSDLAAVGADPIGLLLNQTFSHTATPSTIEQIQAGIRDACAAFSAPLLGGDTNFSAKMHMGAVALGFVNSKQLLTRIGCKPNDYLFSSGKLGSGNIFAYLSLLSVDKKALLSNYKPVPRLKESKIIRKYATCCMDTSDGFIATIDQLKELNSVGFEITSRYEDYMDEGSIALLSEAKLPEWSILAGPHGEFELLFCVSPSKYELFLSEAAETDWQPLELGRVTSQVEVIIASSDSRQLFDTKRIRNLYDEAQGNVQNYLQSLLQINN